MIVARKCRAYVAAVNSDYLVDLPLQFIGCSSAAGGWGCLGRLSRLTLRDENKMRTQSQRAKPAVIALVSHRACEQAASGTLRGDEAFKPAWHAENPHSH
jgi:hypothetical protein